MWISNKDFYPKYLALPKGKSHIPNQEYKQKSIMATLVMQLQDMDLSARYYYNTTHTSSTTKQQLAAHIYTLPCIINESKTE